VAWVLEFVPFQIAPHIPFTPLTKFHPHEDGFLARVGPHVCEEGTHISKFEFITARHLVEQMALAVHHLIVAERQHEVFGVVIPDGKSDIALVELAEPMVKLEVIEHVVHPAHVPLQIEAQAPHGGGLGHHRPSGGFFGNGKGAWEVVE
jgi:hypothetical protein